MGGGDGCIGFLQVVEVGGGEGERGDGWTRCISEAAAGRVEGERGKSEAEGGGG